MCNSADQRLFMELGGQTTRVWNRQQANGYMNHINEEARETREAWEAGDMMKTVDGVIDLMVVCEGFLASLGIDGREGWEAVMKANFSKVDSSLGPIVWREDGQIGKPEGFVPPDAALRKIVDRAISVQKE